MEVYLRQSSQDAIYVGHLVNLSTILAASGSAWKLNSAASETFPMPSRRMGILNQCLGSGSVGSQQFGFLDHESSKICGSTNLDPRAK